VTNIIVAFAKIDDAKSIKNILVKNGMSVAAVCSSGAQALGYADEFHDGIVICGYKLADMICAELGNNLPKGFEMIVLASPRALSEISGTGIMGLSMPLKVHELVDTVGMMSQGITRRRKKLREKKPVRNEEETAIILHAKGLLMERNSMTEEEAHRYIQKHSMDNGTNMVETAQMVLSMFR
jgi:response regulator NasT